MQLEQYYINEGISLVHTKNVQAVQIVTPVMFVKQVITVYVYFLTFYSTPNASICECASVQFFFLAGAKKCGMGTRLDRYDLVMRGLRYNYTK